MVALQEPLMKCSKKKNKCSENYKVDVSKQVNYFVNLPYDFCSIYSFLSER